MTKEINNKASAGDEGMGKLFDELITLYIDELSRPHTRKTIPFLIDIDFKKNGDHESVTIIGEEAIKKYLQGKDMPNDMT